MDIGIGILQIATRVFLYVAVDHCSVLYEWHEVFEYVRRVVPLVVLWVIFFVFDWRMLLFL